MEAVEANRKGKRANVDWYNKKIANSRICQGLVPDTPKEIGFEVAYNETIKGSIEEELADAVIRLLDLCGLRKIDIEDFTEEMLYDAEESCNDETFTESIYAISTIPIRYEYEYGYPLGGQLNSMLLAIFGLAKHLGIDLIWHINQKMRYNELRENKHGKKY
jgi:NTP pyrophosphatase (non-canonical NTP hydrolase)